MTIGQGEHAVNQLLPLEIANLTQRDLAAEMVTVQGGVVLFVLILYALVDDARAKEVVANGRALARLT
jgi:hypothetical protein